MMSQIELPKTKPSINHISTIATTESSVQVLVKLWRSRQNYQQKIFKFSSKNNLSIAPWRICLVNLLESPQAHIITTILLVFDLVLSVVELLSSLTPTSCKNNAEGELQAWYHWVGISILGLLFFKVMLLGVGLGRLFLENLGNVVDGVVVGVALVLEVVIERVGGGLLVVVSLWRVVRAIESVYELSDEAIQAKIDEVICEFGVLKEENKRLLETIAEERKVILMLQDQLARSST